MPQFAKILYFGSLCVESQPSECIISINFDHFASSFNYVRGVIFPLPSPPPPSSSSGASLAAKLNIIPIRRGFWGRPQAMTNQSLDRPHTLPCKVNGSFGSVTVRLVPAPRGSGCGSAPLVVQRSVRRWLFGSRALCLVSA